MLTSGLCKYEHFGTPWFSEWSRIGPPGDLGRFAGLGRCDAVRYHRKHWEYVAISQALHERGMLTEGKRGLGFAVGAEPLVSLFASFGPKILATDAKESEGTNWAASGQYVGKKDALFIERLIDKKAFDERVEFQHVDMRDKGKFPEGKFDFIWSACAFEHLGSLGAGITFVEASSKLLAPGGVAVHTTEFNVSSNARTVHSGGYVLYRQQDMEHLARMLAAGGSTLLPFDFDPGSHAHDIEPDFEPWYTHGREHVKLVLAGFTATSALLIIQAPR